MVTPLEAVSSSGTGLPSPLFRRVVVANADAIAPAAHKSKIMWEMYIKLHPKMNLAIQIC